MIGEMLEEYSALFKDSAGPDPAQSLTEVAESRSLPFPPKHVTHTLDITSKTLDPKTPP